jgi:DNA polymerase-3 subunit gamma/tau
LLGYTDAELLDEVVDAFGAADAAAVFQAVDRVVESGHDPRRFAADLLERVRDLIVVDAVPDAADKGLIDAPADQLDRMRAQAARFGRAELSRAGDILNAGLTEMRGATAPRLLLELLCARLLLPAAATDAASMLARLDRIERRLDIAGPSSQRRTPAPAAEQPADPPAARRLPGEPVGDPPPARVTPASNERSGSTPWPEPARPAEPERPADAPEESVATTPPPAVGVSAPLVPPSSPLAPDAEGGLDAAAVRRVWPQVLDAVKTRRKMTTWALLSQYAQVVGVRGRTLLLAFATEPIRRQWDSGVNEQTLVDVLAEILGVDWRIEALTAAEPAQLGADGGTGVPAPDDDPRDDPVDDAGDDPAEPALPPEERAVALLQNELGAKLIGEIDAG